MAKPKTRTTKAQSAASKDNDEGLAAAGFGGGDGGEAEDGHDDRDDDAGEDRSAVWMRGLFMVILAVLFWLAETILLACAVLQFGWLLFAGRRNDAIAEFGGSLAGWLGRSARFLSGASEEKPFPWTRWGAKTED